MTSTERLEENSQNLIEIIAILNGPESPTRSIAYEHNIVERIEELLELYAEAQGKVDEIQDMVRSGW